MGDSLEQSAKRPRRQAGCRGLRKTMRGPRHRPGGRGRAGWQRPATMGDVPFPLACRAGCRVLLHGLWLPLCTAWCLVGCGDAAERGLKTAGKAPALMAREEAFERRVLLTGEVDAVAAAELKVPAVENGRAPLRWLAANGAEVKKGDLVAELDNAAFATELQQKVLQVSQAESELQRQQSQAALTASERVLDVERKRIAMEKARLNADMPADLFSKRDVIEAKLAFTKAETEWLRAKESLAVQRRTAALDHDIQKLALQKVQRELKVLEEGILNLSLRAPLDGVVLVGNHPEGRPLQVGDEVWMGMTVARMPDLRQIRVKAWLADVDDGQIAVGMPAEVVVDTYPDQKHAARVDSISTIAREPMQKSLRRVFEVSLTLEGNTKHEHLRPGLSARVEVIASKLDKAVVVPRAALVPKGSHINVITAEGQETTVTLGTCNSRVCVVKEGLAADTRLQAPAPFAKERPSS